MKYSIWETTDQNLVKTVSKTILNPLNPSRSSENVLGSV